MVNTGGSHLFPVTVDDTDLGIDQEGMTLVSGDDTVPLPPAGELVYAAPTTIGEDLVNTASALGIPSDETGDPTPDDPVTDVDDAEVRVRAADDEVPPADDVDPAPPDDGATEPQATPDTRPQTLPAAASQQLPTTGSDTDPQAAVGAVLVLLGIGALLGARLRKRASAR